MTLDSSDLIPPDMAKLDEHDLEQQTSARESKTINDRITG